MYPDPLANAVKQQKVTQISINAAASDVATFQNLPAKYRIKSITAYDASTGLGASAATLGIFTAAAGGGSAVVAATLLTALSATSKLSDLTLALANDVRTESTLYIRNVVAHGSAATISLYLEYVDLT